ncbi:uncharacterized protein LOC133923008 [Phragmites australis]|uniref:uncharacterized protein LOC133923008 n=1 Tax=Phragmites australis TaxID=29695 RepID=UPI002D782F3E|nr:uncharacterized protein LOC133923008 [Phragmites australis]
MASSPTSGSSSSNPSNPFAPFLLASSIPMINIHSHVPLTLDMVESNFSAWRTFFDLALNKFGLTSHINDTLDAQLMRQDPEQLQADSYIVSWLYSTISREILTMVIQPNEMAYGAWTKITGLFLDNCMQHAVYAQQEFHSLYQGDLTINKYYSWLKQLTDTLRDIGSPVTDQALVINTL